MQTFTTETLNSITTVRPMKTTITPSSTRITHRRALILASSIASLFAVGKANAANLTWNSAGPTNNWSTAAGNGNWLPGGVLWTNNDSAIFDLSSGAAESIDVTVANTVFDNMTFDVTGFTIGSGGAGTLLLGNDLASTITVTNGADTATVNETLGNNAGGASSLTKAGAGTLVLTGTAANTYSGGTTISAGTVTLNHEGALGTGAVTNNGTLNIVKIGTNLVYTGLSTAMSGNGVTNVTLGAGTVTTILNGNYSGYTGTWNVGVGAAAGAGKIQLNGLDNAASTINILANSTVFVSAAVTKNASVVLNGGDTGESIGQLRVEGNGIWAGNISLAGAMTGLNDAFIGVNAGTGTFSGIISEAGGSRVLSKSGAGTSVVSGTNTYSGGTSVLNGTVSVSVLNNTGVAGNVGTGSTINLGNLVTGAGLTYTGAGEMTDRVLNLAGTTGGIVLTQSGVSGHLKFTSAMTATGAGAKTLTLQGSTAATAELAGAIVNSTLATAITKTGTGTWTLSGANTNTGATAVNQGTLRLNYDTGAGGTDSNKIADAGVLTLGGGTLELVGGSHTEIVASTTLTAGTNNFVNRTGGSAVLQLGAITPNAGTSLTFNAGAIATTTTANHASGILGTWARVGSAWATSSGGSIVAYTGYTDVSQFFDGTPAGTIPTGANNNVRIINGGTSGNITLGGGALTQAYTLQNDSTGATIAPAAGTDVLNVGDASGGAIWQTSGAGSLVIGATVGNGVLTTGAAVNTGPATLRLINDSVTNALTVNSNITNNTGLDVVSITKTGDGVLVLNGNNSYTGVTTVGSGSTTLSGGGTLVLSGTNTATGNTLVGNGATLQLRSAGALGNTGVANSQLQLFNGSTLQLRGDVSTTYSGTNGIGGLNNATVGIDVNQATSGTNNVLTISAGAPTSIGNAVTINVTGGNGYTLATGTIQNIIVANATLTLNPTTGNMALGGFQNQFAAANTNTASLVLSGTSSGNSVTGVIANQGAGSLATGAASVTKIGTSTWDLQGANTYTGATTVREGTLILSGNRTVTSGAITVGDTAGLAPILNLSAGSWSLAALDFRVGNALGSTGTVNQTGGAITWSGGNQLLVGAGAGTGTYNLSAGTITGFASATRGVLLGINTNSTGTFNLSGTGILAMSTAMLQLSRSDAVADHATGIFNQTGGTATFGTLTIGGGAGSQWAFNSGTLNLTGGTFVANAFTLLGAGDNSTSVINIGGSALVTLPAFPTARGLATTSTLNFDGGTLRPLASSAVYLGGLTNAFVKAGGAAIDTNNFNITVSQPLLTDPVSTGGGLAKSGAGNLTLTGASTYTGATNVSGGTLTTDVGGSINGSSGVAITGGAKLVQLNTTTAIAPAVTLTQGTVDGVGTINTLNVADLAGNVVTNGNGSTNALTFGNLTFNGDATVNINTAGSVSVTVTNALTTTVANGQVTINVPVAPIWSNGATYNLIGFGSFGGAVSDFTKGTIAGLGGRQSATLGSTGPTNGFITLSIVGDSPVWTGATSGVWSTTPINTPFNWKLQTAGADTEFLTGDTVIFDDTATGTTDLVINDATVAPVSTFFNNATKTYTLGGTNGITSGFVVKSGAGPVTINTANTYTGGTTVNAGTVNIGNASALGAAASTLTLSGGTLDNTSGAALTTNNHPLVINGDFAFTGTNPLNLGAGAANLGSAGGAARTVTVNASTLTLGGVIANGTTANGITKAGNGTLLLTAANTYTGTTTINAGAVIVQNNAALGTNASGTTISGTGTLDVSGTLAANALNLGTEVITVSGSGVGGAGAIVNNGTNDQINALGRLVLAGDATIGGSKRWDLRSSTPTLNMGGFNLTKVGGNQVSLVGVTVSNPGNITINGGIFGVETTTNLGGSAANAINVNEFATLNLFGNTIPVAWTVNLTDGTLAQNNTNATVSGAVTLTGANTITGTGTNLTLTGAISGLGGFTKTGAVQLNLSGDNSYDGTTAISVGRVVISHANALGSATGGTTVANNAILQVAGGVTTNSGETVSLIGPGSDFFGSLQGGTGGGTWAGGVTLGDTTVRIGATTANTLTITGTIADGAGTGFNVSGQVGTGVVVINPTTSNTYTGTTGVIRGILRIGKNDALPTGTALDVDSANGVTDAAAVDLNGFNQTVGALQDTATTNVNGIVTNGIAATTSTLTVNGIASTTFNGIMQNGAGTVALAKSGSGALTLAGVNTYTGSTLVDGGALVVSGSISGSAVTVSTTGTIGGTGTIGALTALSGGTVAPGASPGILNSGALSMTTGSTLSLEINGTTLGTGYDQLSVTGGVDITGATLTLGGTFNGGPTSDLFTILLNDGGDLISGTFAGLSEGAHAFSSSGQEFTISYVGGTGNDIVLTAVPEPGSAALLLGGFGMLVFRRRRRA